MEKNSTQTMKCDNMHPIHTLKSAHKLFPQEHHSLCHILHPKVWASIVYCWPKGKGSHTTFLIVKTHICEH
jgi:hypothetical protein